MVPDAPRDSEEPRESETEDECLPPHFVDIFAGRNRPMSRAMEWCGWTTSSFEKFPADCSCSWAECRCGKSKDVRLESVQTEAFSEMRRAQATWIALDCHTLTKANIPTCGQQHHHEASHTPLRSAEDLWGKARLEPSSNSTDWGPPPLSAEERSQLLEQNELIAFVEEALKVIHEANEGQNIRQLGIIENPRKSWLWDFDFMRLNQWSLNTADEEEWTDVDYLSCFWGGVRAKKQRLRTNMRSAKHALHVGGMAGVQCHDHHLQEWEPWHTSLGEWVMPDQAEKEYPARFTWQMAVAVSCETAKRLQFRLSVPRSPALQPLVGGDRSWWTTLPANTVSELMMVPIGLQLMLCPPKDEGHIPPVICAFFLQQLPEGAVCCGTKAAEKFQAEAKFLNPFEHDKPEAGNEEAAVMQYMEAWLKMPSTARLKCVSALVGRVLVTDSMPGKISHVHFLAAMVADYVKKNLVVTSADVAQIPREALAPRAQAVFDTATKSRKRGWLQHVRDAVRKWSRPIAELAAAPKPQAKPQPKAKAKPAVKKRPGALRAAVLATAAATTASLTKKVPLMHTQEDCNCFLIKIAPEGSLQGSQISCTRDLIDMKPGTLWGKFRLREREEHASSGPQAKARMWQQPGTLNSESTMQPLLMTGLSGRGSNPMWHPMVNSSWLPCGEVTFTEDMVLSAAWTQQNRTSRRREKLQPRQTDSRGVQYPTDATCGHRHFSGHHHHIRIKGQANRLPARLLQGCDLMRTTSATGSLRRYTESHDGQRNFLSGNRWQSLIEALARPR